MTRTFYDSTNPAAIPSNAAGVGGYVDGAYKWSAGDWARFPNAVHVRIACFAFTDDGHVLDVESGCSSPADAPQWVQRRRAAGVDPTVYMSESAWGSVRQAFTSRGVAEPHYWVAWYDGRPDLSTVPGAVAKQYADPAAGSGGDYDVSVVADYWPGVDLVDGSELAGRLALRSTGYITGKDGKDWSVTDLSQIDAAWLVANYPQVGPVTGADNYASLKAIEDKIAALSGSGSSSGDQQIIAAVQALQAQLTKIENALRGA